MGKGVKIFGKIVIHLLLKTDLFLTLPIWLNTNKMV